MPVPDHVFFGPAPEGQYTYKDVRSLAEPDQFLAIRERVGRFFNSQVSELGVQGSGKKKVYSPFPLFLLTCVGAETLGRLFFGREPTENEQREDVQRECFIQACCRIHQKFGKSLPKEQQAAFDGLWGAGEHKKHEKVAVVVYRLSRHTMAHGYQARGVYLTESHNDFKIVDGALELNPYIFWCEYLSAYDKLWNDFLKCAASFGIRGFARAGRCFLFVRRTAQKNDQEKAAEDLTTYILRKWIVRFHRGASASYHANRPSY